MEVFTLYGEPKGYYSLYNLDPEYRDRFPLDGSPLAASWTPMPVHVFHSPDGERQVFSDCPSFKGGAPVFTRRAAEALQDVLLKHGELLPLICDEGEYLLYNPTTFLDALDTERSAIEYLDDGRFFDVDEYVFHEDVLHGAVIFKLPQQPRGAVYVTDAFVRLVEEHGLTGFQFRKVWEG